MAIKRLRVSVALLLTLSGYGVGLLIRVAAALLRTHDWSLVSSIHLEMAAGDVVVMIGFFSHAHLLLRFQGGFMGFVEFIRRCRSAFTAAEKNSTIT